MGPSARARQPRAAFSRQKQPYIGELSLVTCASETWRLVRADRSNTESLENMDLGSPCYRSRHPLRASRGHLSKRPICPCTFPLAVEKPDVNSNLTKLLRGWAVCSRSYTTHWGKSPFYLHCPTVHVRYVVFVICTTSGSIISTSEICTGQERLLPYQVALRQLLRVDH